MSEFRCTYYDPAQGTQTLGLYHGQDSGNVVIYHNSKVLIIDFMVHQAKTYSLMINENLVKLNVIKKNGQYNYNFEATRVKDETLSTTEKFLSFFKRPFAHAS